MKTSGWGAVKSAMLSPKVIDFTTEEGWMSNRPGRVMNEALTQLRGDMIPSEYTSQRAQIIVDACHDLRLAAEIPEVVEAVARTACIAALLEEPNFLPSHQSSTHISNPNPNPRWLL